ncbi:GNAT family N-acetyltransferase [Clostridium estertheticum]|uniref:GNAT family N-acetyltransferase n=1 Tax=Clostridium estertheticum TaxID=238834 RepID=UPI0013E93D02|nr:GNAT family N-acetyltransferase [Clostridium estertheticum]MBZ9689875.1 GNAT family N-acetyltransferase [Clostridium estertheticum]
MLIIKYNNKYRDDMIYMVLEAKNALGRIPRLNEDLLDIDTYYISKGDMFWLAVDEKDRVIGCIGTKTTDEHEMWLKRLYVKVSLKRNGIGGQLLKTAETYATSNGITNVYTRFAEDYVEAQNFYPKNGFTEIAPNEMVKYLS